MMTYLEIQARIMAEFTKQCAIAGDVLSFEFMTELNRRLASDDQANYRLAIQKLAEDGLILTDAAQISITKAGIVYLNAAINKS